MTWWLSYWPQKGQKGTFWAIFALEQSKVCALCDFGHLQFLKSDFFRIRSQIFRGDFFFQFFFNKNAERSVAFGEYCDLMI
jgi:hypothetical protein